jgi:hypothetical protein
VFWKEYLSKKLFNQQQVSCTTSSYLELGSIGLKVPSIRNYEQECVEILLTVMGWRSKL